MIFPFCTCVFFEDHHCPAAVKVKREVVSVVRSPSTTIYWLNPYPGVKSYKRFMQWVLSMDHISLFRICTNTPLVLYCILNMFGLSTKFVFGKLCVIIIFLFFIQVVFHCVTDIAQEFINIIEKCPSKLKRKINSITIVSLQYSPGVYQMASFTVSKAMILTVNNTVVQ